MSSRLILTFLAVLVAAAATPTAAQPAQHAAAVSVNFRMVEWDILPLTATKTKAARVTFVVRNAGKMTHEFVVMRTAKSAGKPGRSRARSKLPRREPSVRSKRSSPVR